MNLFQEISLAIKARKVINQIKREGFKMNTDKASTIAGAIAGIIVTLLGLFIKTEIPASIQGAIATALGGIIAIIGWLINKPGNPTPKP